MIPFLLAYAVCVTVIYAAWNWVFIPSLDRRPAPVGRPWPIGQLPTAFAVAAGRIEDRPVDLLIVCAKHGGEDKKGYIRLFPCESRQLLLEFAVPGLGNNLLAASRNGRYLAVTIAYGENNVRLYSLPELLKLRRGQQPHHRAIAVDKQPTALAFSPDGRALAIGTIEGTISVYNLDRQGEPAGAEYVRLWHDHEIKALAFSPKDPALLVSGSAEGVTLWHSLDAWGHSKNAAPPPTPITGQALWRTQAPVTALAFNEQGILAAAAGSVIRLMAPSDPQKALDLSHPGAQALAFHGPLLVSAGPEGKLWDLRQEEARPASALDLTKPPPALAIYAGGARFVAWTKHFSALLQVGRDDMARERPLSDLTHAPLPEVVFEPVREAENWTPVSAPASPVVTTWTPPAAAGPQRASRAARSERPSRERHPLSPMQKLGVPVALCSAILPSLGVYLLHRPIPPEAEPRQAARNMDFPELRSRIEDARKLVQKAQDSQNSQKAGHKALAKAAWMKVQAFAGTMDAEDHPDWFARARQEQQAATTGTAPKGLQNEALDDVAESRLDLAKADMHLNALEDARKAMTEIESRYSQARITEPDGKTVSALQAVQTDLAALRNGHVPKSVGTASHGRRPKKPGRSSSRKTS